MCSTEESKSCICTTYMRISLRGKAPQTSTSLAVNMHVYVMLHEQNQLKQFNESSCSRCVSHTDVSNYFLLWEDVLTPLWHVTCSTSTEAFRDRVHVSKHICDANLQPDVEKSVPKRRISQYTEMHWLIESAWDTLTIILMLIRTQRRMLCVISISKTQ